MTPHESLRWHIHQLCVSVGEQSITERQRRTQWKVGWWSEGGQVTNTASGIPPHVVIPPITAAMFAHKVNLFHTLRSTAMYFIADTGTARMGSESTGVLCRYWTQPCRLDAIRLSLSYTGRR